MSEPTSTNSRLAGLSREQRALLFEQLRKRKESAGTPPAGIPRRPPDLDPVPASFAQERLWFMDRLAPGNAAYNIPAALRIDGEVSPALLEAVLGEVVRRHEALRTTFREARGKPVQVIAPPSRWSLPMVDLSALPGGLSGDWREAETRRLALEDAVRPFDLEAGPLLRATLLRLEPASSVLLLNLHHIVSDGWSMGVLVGEITALYGAAVAGRPSSLPELPVQYADFAVWQRGWLQGEVLERQLAYWRERLAGVPVTLDLPADRPRPAVPTYRGARPRATFGRDLKEGLTQLARRHEASLYMVLLAGFQALLGRLTGQEDFSVGSPIANRHRPEVEPLIGFFVNSLVIRGELKGDPSFHELLALARKSTLEAFAHQDLPFERMVEELQPERHLSVTPLFQVVLALQNAPVGHLDLPGLSLSPVELEATTVECDLELHLWETEDSLLAVLAYSTELFDEPTVLRIAGHLETLLRGALADPGRSLSELPLLSEPERAQLLREWNDTWSGDWGDVPLHRLVEERAAAQPDALAVLSAAGERLTYGELDARAGRLARRLRDLGVGPESRVVIAARRSPELIVGMLAVLKAGGAYVPVDPSYPAERVSLILEDSGAVARLGDGDLPDAPGPVLSGEEIDPASAAYVIYTSGSTGIPKGVVVSHRSISRYVRGVAATYRLAPDDRELQFSSLGFDTSVDEIWCPLAAGATLVLRSEEAAGSLTGFLDEVERLGVTVLSLPTAYWHELAAALGEEGRSLPARVRLVVIGGEEAQPHRVASWLRDVQQVELLNAYGPTETTITATFSGFQGWNEGTPVPIGRPREGARVYGVDRGLRLVPPGVWGELLIGGDGVARGYLNRPDLTAERFVPDAWSGEPGARVYRSGDLVRFRPDGELQFGGRMDQQVKIRGFRIEPGEIESALLRHPRVREAVVELRKGVGEGSRLVAWVVHRPEPADVSADRDEHVDQWRTLHDESYVRDEAADTTFDIKGWDSSYTGQPIPAVEMREWVERTVERILSLRPRRVVEIGCGTGLLLFRVAPATERYLGTDFSRFALEGIRRLLARGGLSQVELLRAEADDWRRIAPGEADLVILNSVAQYFPGVDYLARVLEGAVRTVAPGGGSVFIGDVRSLPLLEAFAASVERFQSPDLPPEELKRRVLRRVMDEEELVVDPLFFFALAKRLPAVRRVSVLLKRGRWHNELTRFRYDVVLHTEETGTVPLSLVDGSGFSLGDVERLLEPRAVAVGGLADARVTENGTGIDPEDLWELAERRGYDAELSVHPGSPGRFRALFKRKGSTEVFTIAAPDIPDLPWSAFANDPLRSRLAHRLGSELRRALQAGMPDYMVPSAFVVLDSLPITPNGKVDRAALPDPEPPRSVASTPPRTPDEKALAALWKDVLGIEEVGLEDNFFELGGHSLLATQLVSRVSTKLGVDLPLRTVFEHPTLGALAAALAGDGGVPPSPPPPAISSQELTKAPLSFAQERLWFLERLQPGRPTYNMPLALRLQGAVAPALLASVLGEVVRRHGALRTTFEERAGEPVQIVAPPGTWVLPQADLAGLSAAAAAEEARRLAGEDALRPFDLQRGPLLRVTLLRLQEEHVLLLAMHHIVSDGWSMGVLVREITALYGAALAGIPSPLPELALQYADFAVWQRGWLREGEMERQLSYWRRQLAGIPPSLDLPLDRPRPPVPSSKGGRLPVVLGPDLTRGLARLARGHGATLFMVFLAGFQALLRRVTGQEDIPVGAPIANRNRAEIEPLIGFFVNTLVMRGDLAGDPSFRELLARAKRTTLEAYANQDLPFERLVLELNPERSLSVTPLFQVLFVMQNVPEESADLPGLRLEPLSMAAPSAQFDLTLSLDEPREGPEGFGKAAGEINYNADLFHVTTVMRLVGYLRALLASAVADPERRLSEIPLLSEAEQAQVLWEWSGTPWEGGGELLLHWLVQARAAADPDALAVLSPVGESLTYGELDARAGRLARRLRDLGAGPESRVAVAASRSPGLIVGMLAVLKTGGAYVPIDPGYPAERVAVILEDSGAVALLGDGDLGDRPGPSLADLEEIEAADPTNAAYVIYTSGSTGRPKGVVVSHRSAAIYVRDMAALQGLGPGDRVLQFGALGFDVTVQEIWCPLISGATLVLRSEEMAGSVERFLAEVARLDVTTLPLPTAYWHELAAAFERTGEKLPASVRRLTIGGEAVQPARLASWLRQGHVPVLNCYGPTETTVAATTTLLSGWREGEAVPIGRPSHGARVYVVDAAFQLVPPGVWGELWIGGTGVARGYLGRPDLTAAAFVPNPWSGEPGERAYRSGDRVRFLPAGDLEFGGRIDHQIKVRGFRVEPGETEAVLATHPGLEDVAVVARRGPAGETSLLACAVPAEGAGEPAPAIAELRSFLAGRLPAHLVPAAFVLLPALPLTPNGKVDRQALSRLAPDRPQSGDGAMGTPPGTPAEEAMAALWREVLEVDQVFLEESFFDLGGHSLLAMQLVSRVRATFNVELPLRRLFEDSTLAGLAAAVAREDPRAMSLPPLEARRPPGSGPVPASFAQERLWFLDRLRSGDPAYNIPTALRLLGELKPAVLEAVLGEAVRRHEALRTTFEEREGKPVQVIAPPGGWLLPLADLSALPEETRRAEASRVTAEEAVRSFDLLRGPLLRAVLLRLGERDHALLLTMHHIISDGWSMGVLVREVGALYAAAAAGTPSPLPELPVQYPDFALWQRRWLEGGELERQLAYWRVRLDGVPASLDLPTDRPRPAVPSHRGALARFHSGPALATDLERFARGQGATLFMVILAGFQALLSRLSGQEDFAVGSPIANRTRAEIEPLIGFFVNTLALRSDLAGDPSFQDLLARVRRITLEAYAHQDLPFEHLVKELRPERHLSLNPVFQVMCALQNAPIGEIALPGLTLEPLEVALTTSQFDLELNVWEHQGSLSLLLTYGTELFDPATVLRLGGALEALLRGAVADPSRPFHELPLFSASQRHQLLVEWNDTGRTAEPGTVMERFAAQVARTPEAVALEAGGERLTYGELDSRSNRLAHRLRRSGVGPGVVVGLLVERSVEMVTGILAVWKAGGAYVPLDPGLPKARLDYLLEDSRVALVLDGSAAVDLTAESDLPLAGCPQPDDLAYRIYTSGTTGLPKAVEVEHRQLASTLAAVQEAFVLGPEDRMPGIASFSFDIFLFELLGPLLAGGTSVLLPLRPSLDLERLLAELETATLLHAVPAVMRQVVDLARQRGVSAPRLRGVFTGGDTVPADLLADLRATFPNAQGWVLYGPTEAAIVCSSWPVPAEGPVRSLLGRPFARVEIRICDRAGRPAPIGVPGEIWIGGTGVARGYWRREELTAEKFVEVDGRRFYRSGDLARRLPDGTLEFLGRGDQQVKVRGFRIELGEVEAALLRQPGIGEAVVAAPESPDGRRLIAYVVPEALEATIDESAEQVEQWRALYDETYGRGRAADATLELEGWNSSYTGEPIPEEEMREWVEGTVARLLALPHARVLEVGCGTGLLTFRVAPQAVHYVGTDFSPVALEHVRREAGRQGLSRVTLERRTADDWSGVEPGSFDLVVINSVVQYFPSVDYLLRVLEGAARAVRPGGAIFVGDVRSLPLLEALHLSVELFRASGDMPVAELRRRVRRRVADEEELLLDPAFFRALSRILPVRAEILPKPGHHFNELTRFRYDAVLHVGTPGNAGVLAGHLPDPDLLQARLASELAAVDLLAGAGQDLETVDDLRRAVAERIPQGFDPRRPGYGELAAPPPDRPWSAFTNDPLRGRLIRRLVPQLRRALQDELPDYMVPSLFVVLDSLPLTVHGKVDRNALPEPDPARSGPASAPPRTPLEQSLAAVWRELLGVDEVGLDDNFFELGGHSLLATQLVSRVREACGVELPLRVLFERPTLGRLAAAVAEEAGSEVPSSPEERVSRLSSEQRARALDHLRKRKAGVGAAPKRIPRRAPDSGPAPASLAQERLWFMDRLAPGNSVFNMPSPLRLRGPLEPEVLERSFQEVFRRHEALRTRFEERDGAPVQVAVPPGAWSLPLVDLRALAPEIGQREAERLATAEAVWPFDLSRGPLLRAVLVHIADEEHALLMTCHHIVTDGWSMGILVRELTEGYRAFATGRPSSLPELPIQYADYAAWQRARLANGGLEEQIGYWRERLAGAPASLDLPLDRPRPAVQTYRGDAVQLALSRELSGRLQALSVTESASLFMTLLAGLKVVLLRWSGQDDVVVGTPLAGRERSETEGLIGYFLNLLALRTRLTGRISFRELLRRVRETALGGYSHQSVPFERLLLELDVERDLSRAPVFQVLFNMLNFPESGAELPGGIAVEPLGDLEAEAKYDFTLYAQEGAAGISFNLVYNPDLFDRDRMEELLRQLQAVLEQVALDPDQALDALSLVTPEATVWLPDLSRPLAPEWPGAVHERFLEIARRSPERPAAGVWTYGDLDAASGRLAAGLLESGVAPGEPVAVWAYRAAPLAAALLGVLRAGAAFVVLDPAYPPARLVSVVERARPRAWVAVPGAPPPPSFLTALPRLDVEGPGAPVSPGAPCTAVHPDAPAWIAFTSGSTGEPKGIVGTHRPLSHFLDWHTRTFGLGEEDRFSLLSGLAHDPLLRDVFTPLWVGGSLHAPDPELERLADWMRQEEITVGHLTPAMGRLLEDGCAVPSLRLVCSGGEALTSEDVARLRRIAPAARLVNFYGATETPQAMGWKVVEGTPARVPLGRGIEGVDLLVLGPTGELAGVGELGEVCIRTPYLALGYLNDPAATAERFAPAPGGRLYRTGDLGRYEQGGDVTYAGRADRQVKIRGFRVELGEIEAALAAHPALEDVAVVVARRGTAEEISLLACAVPARGAGEPSVAELRSFLAGSVPAYMIPASFVVLPAMPLTPNGKVDRQALARLAPDRPLQTPPGTPVEKALADLWREVLEVRDISLEDDFFELGGHSLLATQLISRMRARLGVELPLRTVFERPTLSGQAAVVAAERPAADRGQVPRRPPGSDPVPASFAQERLWFLDRLRPGNPAYNLPQALRFRGDLSPALVAAVLGEVVRRHEALRTVFEERGGHPVQVITHPSRWRLPVADLSALPEEAREAEASRVAEEVAALLPFDLRRGPLLRAAVLRLGNADHALLLSMHHIVSDGWSMGVLVREVGELYRAAVAGTPSPLPELPVQYADFALWQREWLEGGELDRQLAYWRQRLDGLPASLDLPSDRPRPAVPSHRGGNAIFFSGPAVAADLARFARGRGATLFMVVLAAFQALLGRLTGQEDFAVGSPIANRTRSEIEPLIGFFVNTLVLRSDLAGGLSFQDLVSQVRRSTLEAYAHQDLPFEHLVEELQPERHLAINPLFQVMYAVQNAPLGAVDLPGLSLEPLELDLASSRFDLELNLREIQGSLVLLFTYSTDLFDPATVLRLGGALETLLGEALAHSARPWPDLPLLSEGQRHQLLTEWNDAGTDSDPGTAVERFAAQAALTPDAVALAAGGERLTYAELDRLSNRLARRLRRSGVGPGSVAGLLLERSAEMVAGLLAVWKAGGAYVPLDPGLPKARLDYLLEDSQAALVLESSVFVDLAAESDLPLAGSPRPEDLAYRIYTSGTTGLPKAVEVEHRQLASTLAAVQEAFSFGPGDRMPGIASFSFDIFLFELLGPLLAGGSCVLLPLRPTLDLGRLLTELESATLFHAVPAVMRQVVDLARARGLAAPRLRGLFTGGDAVPADLLEDLRATFPYARTRVLYGPTEASIVCTSWPVPTEGPIRSLLGRPFTGAEIRVCDRAGRPAPIGVPGEIWIGGSGVARGYWRREELTAEKFVELDGHRFYRSGDLGRRLPDGNLEFLGRGDQQVKVRGFRVELGEVETALLRQPGVGEAVVEALEAPGGGGRRLVAYVVPAADEGESAPAESTAHVGHWRRLYDETYGRGQAADPTLELEGWNSSYTGEPIPEAEMREWVEGTVARLLALPHARVLEVGCGTGLLLFRVAPEAEHYLGTDFSPVALEHVGREAGRRGLSQVSLERRTADDWTSVEPGSFDLVVINSVVQYFPGVDYLLRVLEGAARAVRPGGAIYIGDVRSLPLLEALHLSVELFRAEGSLPMAELRRRVRRRVADEEELLLDPAFFRALSRALPFERADFLLKPGRHLNELTRFRYDVVLHIGSPGTARVPAGLMPDPELLEVRLGAEIAAVDLLAENLETVDNLRRAVAERAPQGVDPRRLGYGAEAPPPDRPWRSFANDPLRWTRARALVPGLRRALQAELPDYMVPSAILILDSLPLTPHGKVDRNALPEPDPERSGPASDPPRNPLEEMLASLWRELLGVDEVGRDDNFFELGGTSITGAIFIHRLQEALGKAVPVVALFDHPTVGSLAEHLLESGSAGDPVTRGVLVPLQKGMPDRRPLFCVHPVGGEVVAYHELARHLGPDQPVWGLQSPNPPLEDPREMAALYVDALRSVQPRGPYRLAGWSLGGVVAWEMARRLESLGETVEVLALLDPTTPSRWGGPEPGEADLVALFAADLARLHGYAPPDVDLAASGADGALSRVLELGREAGLLPPGVGLEEIRRLFERFRANLRALSACQPRSYGGPVTLFRATASRPDRQDVEDWSAIALGGFQVHDLRGDHYSILRDGVEDLAGGLRRLLG